MTVHRLRRGELSKPRDQVGPGFPKALVPEEHTSEIDGVPANGRRARLAAWLTAADNPLTARVLVNRVWGWHFGQALARTPNDFGAQGEPPTHPDLLDWLAQDFMDHGWSLKRLHRLILFSETYRMGSVASGRGLKVDPENRLLWHFPRHRLEGEAVRDSILACAGSLYLKACGPAVVPPLNNQELTGLFGAKEKWPVTKDVLEHDRRSVYLLERRTFIYPLFAAFDPPEVMASCPQRMRTIVPTQALSLLNSPLAREQSVVFARRLLREGSGRPEEVVPRAWELAFGRTAKARESERARAFLLTNGAAPSLEAALGELCLALFNASEFLYVD